jgi:starvation-inducible DNA-binding protein
LKAINYSIVRTKHPRTRTIYRLSDGRAADRHLLAIEVTRPILDEVTHMLQKTSLTTPTTPSEKAVRDISAALTLLLSDVFALYLKTKNFHWHMSGPHFRDYHLMLDDQGEQIFSMTDVIAERARKLGGTTVRSIGQISRSQRIADNDAEYVKPLDMLAELRDDNAILTQNMREVHSLCDEAGDVATASLLENWIDESEKRTWFLFECCRQA